MFVELKQLLENASGLTLTISATDGGLQVVVSPKAAQGSNSGLVRPLVLTGTPEELDEGFVNTLAGFIKARQTLSDQLAAAQADIEAAAKAAAAQGKEKKSQTGKSKSPAASKPVLNDKAAKSTPDDDDPLFKASESEPEGAAEQSADTSSTGQAAEVAAGLNIFSKEA